MPICQQPGRSHGQNSHVIRRRLRRGSFTSVVDLQAAIKRDITEHTRRAKPFVWTNSATDILAAVSRSPEPSVWVSAPEAAVGPI
mgnify:CR=1 FL=1